MFPVLGITIFHNVNNPSFLIKKNIVLNVNAIVLYSGDNACSVCQIFNSERHYSCSSQYLFPSLPLPEQIPLVSSIGFYDTFQTLAIMSPLSKYTQHCSHLSYIVSPE